ncbi:MAG TPA: hypothetical protein VFS21_03580, partial [Roseiflexaceae bacterium]|nr:hypothetical protein [Roseiflexaceae bacterium]
ADLFFRWQFSRPLGGKTANGIDWGHSLLPQATAAFIRVERARYAHPVGITILCIRNIFRQINT